MKLYATVTSERASKGQGGNKKLTVELKAFDRVNPVATVTLFPWHNTLDDGIPHLCIEVQEGLKYTVETKGEKQKGEKRCRVCGKTGVKYAGGCPIFHK